MPSPSNHARSPRRGARGAGALVALALVPWSIPTGCARDDRRITPTTSGTDLRAMPRGEMIPQPFPGSSLAKVRSAPKLDPRATVAGARFAP